MQTEYVNSLHNNYERIRLDNRPDEKRYQYCILSRGGIRGLLSCDLRYINGDAYLYFDITSKQNLSQLFHKHKMDRKWIRDFVWNLREIRQELDRFLLNDGNILWFPEHIFQDLENNVFSFEYVPYFKEENGFNELMDFVVENMDYEDEELVDFVYKMYEQLEENGAVYFQEQIFEDVKMLDKGPVIQELSSSEYTQHEENEAPPSGNDKAEAVLTETVPTSEKKNIFSIFEGKKNKDKDKRNKYRRALQLEMEGKVVAEEALYESDYGRTIYIPEAENVKDSVRKLYSQEGKMLVQLNGGSLTIGKISDEADLILDDLSISRIHARIIKNGSDYYLEDLNATNGTFKNGLRLKPYEKRKLEEEDEITLGKITIVFR